MNYNMKVIDEDNESMKCDTRIYYISYAKFIQDMTTKE